MRSTLVKPWLSIVGIVLAIGVASGMLEIAGWAAAGPVNAMSYLAWALWLILLGLSLWRQRQSAERPTTASVRPMRS